MADKEDLFSAHRLEGQPGTLVQETNRLASDMCGRVQAFFRRAALDMQSLELLHNYSTNTVFSLGSEPGIVSLNYH